MYVHLTLFLFHLDGEPVYSFGGVFHILYVTSRQTPVPSCLVDEPQ